MAPPQTRRHDTSTTAGRQPGASCTAGRPRVCPPAAGLTHTVLVSPPAAGVPRRCRGHTPRRARGPTPCFFYSCRCPRRACAAAPPPLWAPCGRVSPPRARGAGGVRSGAIGGTRPVRLRAGCRTCGARARGHTARPRGLRTVGGGHRGRPRGAAGAPPTAALFLFFSPTVARAAATAAGRPGSGGEGGGDAAHPSRWLRTILQS